MNCATLAEIKEEKKRKDYYSQSAPIDYLAPPGSSHNMMELIAVIVHLQA
jgi:hypothetical protein